jgi:hypothetical protein
MNKLTVIILSSLTLLLQGGGNPINIPVKNTAFMLGYGQTLSEDLGVSPAHFQEYQPGYTIAGIYTLTVSVANHFYSYPGYLAYKVTFGSQELCDGSVWAEGVLTQVTLICPSPGYLIVDRSLYDNGTIGPVQGKSNLVITWSAGQTWPVLGRDVSLTFTPQ